MNSLGKYKMLMNPVANPVAVAKFAIKRYIKR